MNTTVKAATALRHVIEGERDAAKEVLRKLDLEELDSLLDDVEIFISLIDQEATEKAWAQP